MRIKPIDISALTNSPAVSERLERSGADMIYFLGLDGRVLWSDNRFCEFHEQDSLVGKYESDLYLESSDLEPVNRKLFTGEITSSRKAYEILGRRNLYVMISKVLCTREGLSMIVASVSEIAVGRMISEFIDSALHEVSDDSIIERFSESGELMYISSSVKSMLGYNPQDLKGANSHAMIKGEDRHIMESAIERMKKGEDVIEIEYRWRHAEGHYVWVASKLICHRTKEGVPVEFLCKTRDITSVKERELKLRRSITNERFLISVARTLNENIGEDAIQEVCSDIVERIGAYNGAIFIKRGSKMVSSSGCFRLSKDAIWYNSIEAGQLCWLPAVSLSGDPLYDILKGDELSAFVMIPLYSSERLYGIAVFTRQLESPPWRRGDVELARAASEIVTSHMIAVENIEAQLMAKNELGLIMRAVESSGSGIVIMEVNEESSGIDALRLRYANHAFEEMAGQKLGAMIGKICPMFALSDNRSKQKIKQAIGRESVSRVDIAFERKPGEIIRDQVTVSPVISGGRITHWVCVHNNMTQVVKLQNELLNAIEETQNMVGRELHDDVGQEMIGILHRSWHLSQKAEGAEEQSQKLIESVQRVMQKVRFLAHSLGPVSLRSRGLKSAVAEIASGLSNPDFSIQVHGDDPDVEESTSLHVIRIIQEAIHNSIKHGKSTAVSIKIGYDDSVMLVSVDDNGRGIPDHMKAGFGIRSMQYRASVIGGSILFARRSEGGTRILLTV